MGVAVGVYKVCCASRFLPCGNPSLDYVGLMCVEVTGLVLVSKYMAQSNFGGARKTNTADSSAPMAETTDGKMQRCSEIPTFRG
jgi:hypothetical protein